MATSTKVKLKEFNEGEALNGASLAFSSNGQIGGTASEFVLNFKLYNKGSSTERYSGQVQNRNYYFNSSGVCSDGDPLHNLFIADATIEITSGTIATKGDESSAEAINIDVLQPRETFALHALQGILSRIDNPLLLDNGQITLITGLAFKIAQSMINTAADYRAAQSSETPPASVDIDANNITSTTDKILYNMGQSISSINNKLSGGNGVPVNVTNSSLVTHVSNMLTEPVSITGNVSVISS